jgi:hypothetical protein
MGMPTVVKVLGGYLEVDVGGTGGGGPVDPGFGVPGWPAHPIAPGGRPPYPSQGPGFPTHPIAPGGSPPGIWGGANEGFPTHPIAPGGQPPYPSQGPGFPTHPIYIPPNQPPVDPPEDQSRIEWKSGWTADQGWVTVGIVTPEAPIPTPSS